MKSGLSQNPDLQGVQIWQMGEQSGRDVAELRALQRPICINQKKKFLDFFLVTKQMEILTNCFMFGQQIRN